MNVVDMPPRAKSSTAPAGRVYRSARPLEQLRFPRRNKTVKVYGTGSGRKVPEFRLQKQETLTQMDFLWAGIGAEETESEDEHEEQQAELHTGDSVGKVDESVASQGQDIERKPKLNARQRSTRRTSAGDVPMKTTSSVSSPDPGVLKRGGQVSEEHSDTSKSTKRRRTTSAVDYGTEKPSHIATKISGRKVKAISNKKKKNNRDLCNESLTLTPTNFQTQTITQLDWALTPLQDEQDSGNENDRLGSQSDEPVPYALKALRPQDGLSRKSSRLKPSEELVINSKYDSPTWPKIGTMGPPQTPKHLTTREIPSSESPATPAFLRSGASPNSEALQERSVNTPIPFNLLQTDEVSASPYKLPRLIIEDTFEMETDISHMTDISSTPSKKSSPFKSVRFAVPMMRPSSPSSNQSAKKVQVSKSEIFDSDADSDEEYLSVQNLVESGEEDEAADESCYDWFGGETQFQTQGQFVATTSNNIGNSRLLDAKSSTPVIRARSTSPDLATPYAALTSQRTLSSEEVDGGRSLCDEKTQFRESQRLQTQHLSTLGPRTFDSDVFVSLPLQQVTDIVNRRRTYDIRPFAYPTGTSRLWVYVLKPVHRLTYMAVIGAAKRPGDVIQDDGIGNQAFNTKKKDSNWHAYEIEELYQLADPLSMEQLRENEWLMEAPKKYEILRPVVIDGLIANLMPPIFRRQENTDYDDDDEIDAETQLERLSQTSVIMSPNDTQDAANQLLSEVHQYTQQDSLFTQQWVSKQHDSPRPDRNRYGDQKTEVVPSSQDDAMLPPPPKQAGQPSARPPVDLSQATTVDLTQTQKPLFFNTPHKERLHMISDHQTGNQDVVWESPSRPVRFSSPFNKATLLHHSDSEEVKGIAGSSSSRGSSRGGQESVADADSSIVIPYSIPSSQMLTRSQMDLEVVFDSIPTPSLVGYVGDPDEDDEL